MKRIIIFLSILLMLMSCEKVSESYQLSKQDNAATIYAEAAAPKRAMGMGGTLQQANTEQKIIKSASLRYEVNELDSSLAMLAPLIVKYNAIIEQEKQYSRSDRLYYVLTIRVPAAAFDAFIEEILRGKDIRRLEEKNISARDVTEQFIDIEVRLSTKRQALKRYRELLQKAETVSDMIIVEDKIRHLQEEIESQEARLEYLSKQVDMSEIRISLYQSFSPEYIPDKSNAFGPQFLKSLHRGWKGVVVVFFWFIRLWPLWIFLLLIRIIIRRRHLRNKD